MKKLFLLCLSTALLIFTSCDKLETFDYYNSVPVIKGLTFDEKPQSYVFEISIGHTPKSNKLRTDIINKTPLIQDNLRHYFSKMTAEQLLEYKQVPVIDGEGEPVKIWNKPDKKWEPKFESKLAQDIKDHINKKILGRNYDDGIKEILFIQFQILPFLD